MSGQREYCKRFLETYRARINQNLSRDLAWALASTTAEREHPLETAEREEVEAWLREKVKTIWR